MKKGIHHAEKGIHSDKGSIAVLSALVLTAALAFGAFATDFALLYAVKSDLQNAADAAVLAAARDLPENPGLAQLAALEYAAANDATLTSVEITNSNSEIHVIVQKEVPLFLARILNKESNLVTAKASAGVSPVRSVVGAVPLSITMQDFVYGEEYTLKNAPPEGEFGWYGPVRIDGSGASSYQQALAFGSSTPLSVGQILEIENGNMSGPTQKGLDDRLSSDTRIPRNSFDDHDSNAPQIVYVPVVEVLNKDGSVIKEVKIIGFAAFFIENTTKSGNECHITGRFLRTVVSMGRESSPLGPGASETPADLGLYTIKLLN